MDTKSPSLVVSGGLDQSVVLEYWPEPFEASEQLPPASAPFLGFNNGDNRWRIMHQQKTPDIALYNKIKSSGGKYLVKWLRLPEPTPMELKDFVVPILPFLGFNSEHGWNIGTLQIYSSTGRTYKAEFMPESHAGVFQLESYRWLPDIPI